MARKKRFIVCTALVAMVIAIAGKVFAAQCDGWMTKDFWEVADVTRAETCITAGRKSNARAKDGITPLHYAAGLNESPEIIDALIRHGAKVNARDKFGSTPLHRAAEWNENPDIIDTLIRHGAEVNARNQHGNTLSRLYLNWGRVNARDKYDTPLHCAARGNGNSAIIDALICHGAEVNARNEKGNTPLAAMLLMH